MQRFKFYLIPFLFVIFFSNAKATHIMVVNNSRLDSIYKVWKFKKAELIEDSSGVMRSVAITNYDSWNLTKNGILVYSITDSPGVKHSIPYKIINNSIVLKLPKNENNIMMQFRIKELTENELRLILHVTYTIADSTYTGKEKNRDEDILELIFENYSK